MAGHTARDARGGSVARLPALAASTFLAALVVTTVALAPANAATARGWGGGWGGGGDANANNPRFFLNNGWNNRSSLLAGSMRNQAGIQQIDAGVDASVNTQASNCMRRPGCRTPQRIWGRNSSMPLVRGGVWRGGWGGGWGGGAR